MRQRHANKNMKTFKNKATSSHPQRDRKTRKVTKNNITKPHPSTLLDTSSLVMVQPRKTRPCLTERLLMVRKESSQTNKHPNTKTNIQDGRNNRKVTMTMK